MSLKSYLFASPYHAYKPYTLTRQRQRFNLRQFLALYQYFIDNWYYTPWAIKTCHLYFWNISVKNWPILIIFGRRHQQDTWHKWLQFCSPHLNFSHYTTLWKVEVVVILFSIKNTNSESLFGDSWEDAETTAAASDADCNCIIIIIIIRSTSSDSGYKEVKLFVVVLRLSRVQLRLWLHSGWTHRPCSKSVISVLDRLTLTLLIKARTKRHSWTELNWHSLVFDELTNGRAG